VLDKLKKIFMKKEKTQTLEEANGEAIREDFKVYEEQMKAQEESEAAAENIDSVPEPEPELELETDPDKIEGPKVAVVDGATEIEPTEEELEEMNNLASKDDDYLEFSSEAVGYEDRASQWDIYRTIAVYLQPDEEGELSVLDFGCGRGDFERFYLTEFPGQDIDYVGIDVNAQIINAGVKAYDDEVDIRCLDWFSLPEDLKEDWCINVCSNNLRYDADTTKSDIEYLHATIETMYEHAKKGVVLMLATGQNPDGLINYDPVPLLEWALKKYKIVTLDHSLGEDLFSLIIYKN
jgi:SAM-dependent methyltransferase